MIDVFENSEQDHHRKFLLVSNSPLVAQGVNSVLTEIAVDDRVIFVAPEELTGPGLEEEFEKLDKGMNDLIWVFHCQFKGGFDPFALVRRIRNARSSPTLVLILDCLHEFYISSAERSGAGVLLSRDDSIETLRQGFHAARLGASFHSVLYESARKRFARQRSITVGRGLSQKELGTAIAIADGKSISEISYDWGVSRKTISTFRKRALSKLDLNSDAELVRYFVEEHSYLFGSENANGDEHGLILPG